MKTAIIITGHMRSFDRTLDRLHAHVFSRFPNADFFVSTVKDEDSHKAELLRARYPDARVEIEAVDAQPDCIADLRAKGCRLPTRWVYGQPYMREKYWISVHPQAVARQLWQLEQGWELFKAKCPLRNWWGNDGYDAFVRVRPDLWIHSADMSAVNLPAEDHVAWTPFWGRFDGVNDRLAVMDGCAALAYFTTYSQIPSHLQQGGNLHPETLVKASLTTGGCAVRDTLGAVFSTMRANGEIRPPEITTDDLLHLAANG